MCVCVFACVLVFKTSVLGQSDIKKLRRENYQLRREIWTLRDEYDRLGKLLKTNKCDPYENANSTCSYDCGRSTSECKRGSDYGDGCRCYSCCLDDVSTNKIECRNAINKLTRPNEQIRTIEFIFRTASPVICAMKLGIAVVNMQMSVP